MSSRQSLCTFEDVSMAERERVPSPPREGEHVDAMTKHTQHAPPIESQEELQDLYPKTMQVVDRKVIDHIDVHCRRFIELSPFCCIGTVDGSGRGDVSPRGDQPGFVRVLDEETVLLPDRPGNYRLDSMRNLLERPAIGMMFLIPGIFDVLRVAGRAEIVANEELLATSAVKAKVPLTGLLIHVDEAFMHCGRAVKRGRLWDPEAQIERTALPRLAEVLADHAASADQSIRDEVELLRRETYMEEEHLY